MINFNIEQIEEHEDNLDFLDGLSEAEMFSKELDKRGLDINFQDVDNKLLIDMISDSF